MKDYRESKLRSAKIFPFRRIPFNGKKYWTTIWVWAQLRPFPRGFGKRNIMRCFDQGFCDMPTEGYLDDMFPEKKKIEEVEISTAFWKALNNEELEYLKSLIRDETQELYTSPRRDEGETYRRRTHNVRLTRRELYSRLDTRKRRPSAK